VSQRPPAAAGDWKNHGMADIPEVSAGPGPAADKEPGVRGYDVIVVGAGPVGLWLAAELHRGGVRTAVLERRAERPPHSKALTIYPRTLEQFAMRGIAERWTAEGTPVPSSHFAIPARHFAGA
jgi:hypothetical protein